MKYEYPFLYLLIAIGLLTKRMTWKGWFALSLLLISYIMFCWQMG